MTHYLDKETSDIIKAARFPLILLVIMSHATVWTHVAADPDSLSEKIFCFVTDMFSFNLGRMAVPAFFILSGLFFFWMVENGEMSFTWFVDKWKKRLRTLLIPYLFWNILMFAAIALKNFLFARLLGQPLDENYQYIANTTLLRVLWTGPMNYPLWYMRNLICMSLLAPAIYYVMRHFKWLSLGVLALYYCLPLGFNIPGFDFRSVVFFCVGAWFGIYKFNFIREAGRFKVVIYCCAAAALIFSTSMTRTAHHEYALRTFWLFGIPAFFNLISSVTSRPKARKVMIMLSKYVFFIYGAHEIYILGWTKGGLMRLLGESLPAEYLRFFLCPIVVAATCIILYEILNKLCPKLLKFAIGGR